MLIDVLWERVGFMDTGHVGGEGEPEQGFLSYSLPFALSKNTRPTMTDGKGIFFSEKDIQIVTDFLFLY